MELYRQMTASAETISSTKSNNVKDGKRVKGENQDTEKRQPEVLETWGSYIVGGSAFGWNFITFPGHKPVYYGPTKESFRASQVELQEKRTASVPRVGWEIMSHHTRLVLGLGITMDFFFPFLG